MPKILHFISSNENSGKTLGNNKTKVNSDKLKICELYFKSKLFGNNAGDRLRVFIDKVLEHHLCLNRNIINILNAFALIGEIYEESTKIFTRYIDSSNEHPEIAIFIYIGLLKNLNKFNDLYQFLQTWMDSDSIHENVYNDWLMENFGHTHHHIIDYIIYNKFCPKLTL
jgi:hypothetical protein